MDLAVVYYDLPLKKSKFGAKYGWLTPHRQGVKWKYDVIYMYAYYHEGPFVCPSGNIYPIVLYKTYKLMLSSLQAMTGVNI